MYLCTGFIVVLNNLGRSDNDMANIVKKGCFPLAGYMVSGPTRTKNLEWYLIIKPPCLLPYLPNDKTNVLTTVKLLRSVVHSSQGHLEKWT